MAQTKQFTVRLIAAPAPATAKNAIKPAPTNLQPFNLEITGSDVKSANPSARLLPFLEEGYQVAEAQTNAVFLQIWHAGTLLKRHTDIAGLDPRNRDGLEKQMWQAGRSNRDELVLAVKGFIVQIKGTDRFQFRTLDQSFKQGNGDELGWFWLDLADSNGLPWPAPRTENGLTWTPPFPIHVADAEQAGCFVCLFASAADEQPKFSLLKMAHQELPFINLVHITWQMILEGGLTCVMHVHSDVSPELDENGKPKHEDNRAFRLFGRWVTVRFGSLGISGVDADAYGWDTTPFSDPAGKGEQVILKSIARIRELVERDFLLRVGIRPLPRHTRIKRLFLLAHGESRPGSIGKMSGLFMTNADVQHFLGVSDKDPPFQPNGDPARNQPFMDFVEGLAKHLTADAVVALAACWTGCPSQFARDVPLKTGGTTGVGDFGRYPGTPGGDPENVGMGSFADLLQRQLTEILKKEVAGRKDESQHVTPAVWGHTSRGHALNNAELRCFTIAGSTDIIWLAEGFPPKNAKTATQKVGAVSYEAVQILATRDESGGLVPITPAEVPALKKDKREILDGSWNVVWDSRFGVDVTNAKCWVLMEAMLNNPTDEVAKLFGKPVP